MSGVRYELKGRYMMDKFDITDLAYESVKEIAGTLQYS